MQAHISITICPLLSVLCNRVVVRATLSHSSPTFIPNGTISCVCEVFSFILQGTLVSKIYSSGFSSGHSPRCYLAIKFLIIKSRHCSQQISANNCSDENKLASVLLFVTTQLSFQRIPDLYNYIKRELVKTILLVSNWH